ncbi:hypothetical protein PI125_g23628 [Phytophthora idaei]|nr:hypothetical protein PI125_g23628 [Phytophthora idaei]
MFILFLVDIGKPNANSRKWKARLRAITEAIYKSRNTLSETLSALEKQVHAKPGRVTNPWSVKRVHRQLDGSEDVDMSTESTSTLLFLQSAYSANEISELRNICEQSYGFPRYLRKPTQQEQQIVKGLVEGSIARNFQISSSVSAPTKLFE